MKLTFSYFRPNFLTFQLHLFLFSHFILPIRRMLSAEMGLKNMYAASYHRRILLFLIRFRCQCERRHHIGLVVRISKSKCEMRAYWNYQPSNIFRNFNSWEWKQFRFVTQTDVNALSIQSFSFVILLPFRFISCFSLSSTDWKINIIST